MKFLVLSTVLAVALTVVVAPVLAAAFRRKVTASMNQGRIVDSGGTGAGRTPDRHRAGLPIDPGGRRIGALILQHSYVQRFRAFAACARRRGA